MNCKLCLKTVEQGPGGHRQREFCNAAHKQAYYRQRHQADRHTALFAELEALRVQVTDQTQEIEALSSQITDLRARLDIERLYLEDKAPHTFKAWLRRKQPSTSLSEKLLADELVPARGTRAHYEAHVRRLHATSEEHDDFVRLWKLMLLQA